MDKVTPISRTGVEDAYQYQAGVSRSLQEADKRSDFAVVPTVHRPYNYD